MVRGFGKSAGWTSIVAAGGFVLGGCITAQAADLGGDCCADLEERIAELEATTARKGNRKVSVTVYGKVNEAVMWWDDGQEENAYVVTNDASRTRFGFKGKAKITGDWSAYYKIEVGIRSANSKRSNQFEAPGVSALDLRHAEWGFNSKTWGKFGVGKQKNITKDITKNNLAGTGDVGKYSDAEDYGGGFFLVAKGLGVSKDGVQWRRLIARTGSAPGEGDRINSIIYETPSWHGFTAGVVWGGDDAAGAGIKYKGEFGSVKVKAGIAYQTNTSIEDAADLHGCPVEVKGTGSDADCEGVGGSISVLDTHHGLYANFAAGKMWDDNVRFVENFEGLNVDDTYWFYAAEVGIQQKWSHLGKTTLFGQYYHYEGGGITEEVLSKDPINPQVDLRPDPPLFPLVKNDPLGADIASSEVEFWGVGIMQKIDAAEMKLYSLYRHYDFEATLAGNFTGIDPGNTLFKTRPLEDFDVLMSGAVIYF